MGKPEVYLDMDGVLADFFAEYAKLAGVTSGNYRDIPPAKTDPTLNKMVGTDFFARLPKFPTADQLVNIIVKTFGNYHICSSPLRGDYEGSEKYKRIWIQQHLKPLPTDILITPNKAKYAVQADGTPNILIDDRGSNITAWEAKGGVGIKYQADEDSLQVVIDGIKRAFDIVKGKQKHEPQQLKSLDRGKMIQVAKSGDSDEEHPNSAADLKEDQDDYEIKNYEKLDNILMALCKTVVDGKKKDMEKFGAVAACVLDPDNNAVYGINLPAGNGKRYHAERVAMMMYENEYGEIPSGSIIITTCSPCSEHMDERYDESCTDLINNSNVKKVYCGFLDPTQDEDQREFNLMETKNKAIRDLCETFASTFLDYEDGELKESWSKKYKKSINCNNPKGFSQRAHCAGRKKRQAGGKTKSSSVSEGWFDNLVKGGSLAGNFEKTAAAWQKLGTKIGNAITGANEVPKVNNIIVPPDMDGPKMLAGRRPTKPEDVTHAYRNMSTAELDAARKSGYFEKNPNPGKQTWPSDNKYWSQGDSEGSFGRAWKSGDNKATVRIPIEHVPEKEAAHIGNAEYFDPVNNVWTPVQENFADGRNPGDKGSLKAKVKGKVTLNKANRLMHKKGATARDKQLAHWFINMQKGKKK